MRVTFSPGSISSLSEIMASETTYLDFYITRTHVFIISSTTLLYSHRIFRVTSISEFVDPVSIRIHKKEFISMAMEGTITIYTDLGKVIEVTSESVNGLSMTFQVEYQESNQSSIDRYREILALRKKFNKLDLSRIERHVRTIRSVGTSLNLIDDVLHTDTKNVACFIEAECKNFAIASKEFLFLLRHTSTYFIFQNYLIGESEDTVIICKQMTPRSYSDFHFVKKAKPHFIAKVDITPLIMLSSKLSLNGAVTLDLERGKAVAVTTNKTKVSTNIEVSGMRKRKKKVEDKSIDDMSFEELFESVGSSSEVIPRLDFPSILFSDLIPSTGSKMVELKICHSNIILRPEKEGVSFVTGRNEASGL